MDGNKGLTLVHCKRHMLVDHMYKFRFLRDLNIYFIVNLQDKNIYLRYSFQIKKPKFLIKRRHKSYSSFVFILITKHGALRNQTLKIVGKHVPMSLLRQ